jgi:hypothetical protein
MDGFLSELMIVGTIVSWLGSGFIAWDRVFDVVLGFIIMGIANMWD